MMRYAVRQGENGSRSANVGRREGEPLATRGAATALGGPVMVVAMMVVVMVAGGECGTCKRDQQKGGKNELLHGRNVAPTRRLVQLKCGCRDQIRNGGGDCAGEIARGRKLKE